MSSPVKRVNGFEKASLVVENEVLRQKTVRQHQKRPLEVTSGPSVSVSGKRQVQTYEPPPLFHTTTVFAFGALIIVLANIWTPLALLVVWTAARLQRYFFRINDEPSSRRRLLKDFQRKDQLTAPLRQVPNGIKVEESYWVNRRGMSLMTSIASPDNGKPIKAVVCFCHGYTDSPTLTRRRELFRMVRRGIAVVMIEYEGHGRSDGYLGLITDWDKLIDDTSSFFEQTSKKRFPSVPMFLMGESMGGAVAYFTYNRNPKLYQGVVFVCPMCKIGDDFLPPQWVIDLFRKLAGPKGTASTLGFLPIAPSAGIDIDLSIRPLKQAMLTAFPVDYVRRPRLATARELLDATVHISNNLKNFDAPFIVQHGSMDRITDPRLSKALYDESKSKDKTIRLYDGMFHSLLSGEFDDNIDLVCNDAIDWILERSAPKKEQ
mmetsp:Transcript_11966/g.34460  ORF Transcript_11966/g.34460 Transcript_11966/m.34460 type:complete len:432 (+) Transcript_11966:127-1422(+)|eukprot:CAMPEP_0176001722 /NCGR_PEP_ID=MMETSP0120_2-20121206/272_1 /TAXON_ID=160619 /ORGANISM="Kryptoperidinium foliaceum, Strain CCMP 1326" /LENGTH=431 /DNA_ID=CAMNT_0017334277 /DNA_START=125 /DNA_END=1420 /DNA_ORIENTATION=-